MLWPLAFQEELHLLSQRDFRLIEDEMRKVKERVTAQAGNAYSVGAGGMFFTTYYPNGYPYADADLAKT